MRVAHEEQNVFLRREQLNYVDTATAVDEEKVAAVVLVVVEDPLEALHAQHRHECEDYLLVSEERFKNFRRDDRVNIKVCNYYHTLSD